MLNMCITIDIAVVSRSIKPYFNAKWCTFFFLQNNRHKKGYRGFSPHIIIRPLTSRRGLLYYDFDIDLNRILIWVMLWKIKTKPLYIFFSIIFENCFPYNIHSYDAFWFVCPIKKIFFLTSNISNFKMRPILLVWIGKRL